jgi:hypothetical protein
VIGAPTLREQAVVEAIGRRQDELIALLSVLIGFDTRAPDPDYAPRDVERLLEAA